MAPLTANERITTSLSVIAIVVSLGSTWYTVWRDRQQETEAIVVSMGPERSGFQSEIIRENNPLQVSIQWTGFVANNGAVPVSLVNYELWGVGPNLFTHSKLDLGLFQPDGSPLGLPIAVEPGHAVPVKLRTGVMLPAETRRLLSGVLQTTQTVPYEDLFRSVARQGRDLFGNAIKYQEYGDGSVHLEGPDFSREVHQPVFLLSFTSARGKKFAAQFSFYGP